MKQSLKMLVRNSLYARIKYCIFLFHVQSLQVLSVQSKLEAKSVFAHKEDSRVFRQLKVSRFPALYAGFLLVVFPQLFIDHGWLRFPSFSTGRAFHQLQLFYFPALFTAHGCFYRQRTLASSFHCFMKPFKVALNSCDYFRVNSKRSLQIALIVVPVVVPKIPVESTALLKF